MNTPYFLMIIFAIYFSAYKIIDTNGKISQVAMESCASIEVKK